MAKHFPPVSVSSSLAVFFNLSKSLEVMATLAPSSIKYLVMALPKPLPPPVITITFSAKALSRSIFAEKFIGQCFFCKYIK